MAGARDRHAIRDREFEHAVPAAVSIVPPNGYRPRVGRDQVANDRFRTGAGTGIYPSMLLGARCSSRGCDPVKLRLMSIPVDYVSCSNP